MPTYDYRCDINGQVLEVKHAMSENVSTWGELCERTGSALGETPADSPVQRLISGSNVVKSTSLGDANMPPCGNGGCGSGRCAFG